MSHLTPVPSGTPDEGVPAAPAVDLSALLKQAARGDQEAFARLYDATAARAYGLALRVVRDPAQAEEVTQEAFLEIWRMSTRFDPAKGSAPAWMLTIVHRKAVDRVRSAEASTRRDNTYHDQNQSVDHDATADAAHASMEARRVRQALEQPHRRPARGPRAGLLRRLHTHRSGEHARPPGRHRQDPHPRRTHPVARHDGSWGMTDVHALSGAYAVDALDDLERAHFERHLADCADCQAEVASLQRGLRPGRGDLRRHPAPSPA